MEVEDDKIERSLVTLQRLLDMLKRLEAILGRCHFHSHVNQEKLEDLELHRLVVRHEAPEFRTSLLVFLRHTRTHALLDTVDRPAVVRRPCSILLGPAVGRDLFGRGRY